MNHLHCITALRAKGAPDHLVGMVQAFLYQRKMSVKVTCRNQGASLVGRLKGQS